LIATVSAPIVVSLSGEVAVTSLSAPSAAETSGARTSQSPALRKSDERMQFDFADGVRSRLLSARRRVAVFARAVIER
jgi:hypothetical protein